MYADEIFSKSPAPKTGMNRPAVDVWSSEHLLLSYMPLPRPWLLCVSLLQAISTAMIVNVFHHWRPFLQPQLLCVSLLQAISTATIVMCSSAATGFQLMCQKMWMGKVKQSQSSWKMTTSVLYTSGKAGRPQIWVGSISLSGLATVSVLLQFIEITSCFYQSHHLCE